MNSEKKFKSKKELIIPLEFRIISVEYNLNSLSTSNGIFGPGYASNLTGIIPHLSLKVKGIGAENPISELIFFGFSNLEKEDFIKAYIHKYEKKTGLEVVNLSFDPDFKSNKDYYFERPFIKKEIVSKIEKLNSNEEVIATFNGLEDIDLSL